MDFAYVTRAERPHGIYFSFCFVFAFLINWLIFDCRNRKAAILIFLFNTIEITHYNQISTQLYTQAQQKTHQVFGFTFPKGGSCALHTR